MKNNLSCAGDTRGSGLISGLGRSPGLGNGTLSSILAWKIPWAEESGGLPAHGAAEQDTNEQSSTKVYQDEKVIIKKI